jgi:hypothetical protein
MKRWRSMLPAAGDVGLFMDGSSWLKGAFMFEADHQPAQSMRFIRSRATLLPQATTSRAAGSFSAQIQNVALHHPPALEALVLDDTPIAVRLAVLLSPGLPQEHDPASLAKRISPREWGRSSLQPFSAVMIQYSYGISNTYRTTS